uniref:Capsid protein n=1 Tax=Foveavirus mali TaxID=35350 RepID=A0A0S1YF21_9VIRU|nr:coat protein [Apple stem pitting virus]
MTSNGSQPPASLPVASVEEPATAAPAPNSTPMVSAEGPAAAVSAPSSSVAVSAPASTPAASEPVISQVQSLAPIVSGFDPNLHGRLTNEQIRQARGETARQNHAEGSHSDQRSTSSTTTHHDYTGVNSNPFETGTAYGNVPQLSLGSYLTFPGSGSASEPNAQEIWPPQHGINPSAHGADLMASQPNAGNNVGTPFTLGNRAPRNVTSNAEEMRRRLWFSWSQGIYDMSHRRGVVASNQKIRAVAVALIGMGIPEHQLTEVGVYLARHCADVGASDKSTLLGTFPGSDITVEEVGTMIKQTEGCTLRQYCAFYAKQVWNLMLQTQSPPANWVGKEFKFETRYAAFDFFFGVESTAALEPADGLIRLPTQAERVANATSKEIQMYRIRSMEGTQAVNFGEVFWGKIGPKPVLSIRK